MPPPEPMDPTRQAMTNLFRILRDAGYPNPADFQRDLYQALVDTAVANPAVQATGRALYRAMLEYVEAVTALREARAATAVNVAPLPAAMFRGLHVPWGYRRTQTGLRRRGKRVSFRRVVRVVVEKEGEGGGGQEEGSIQQEGGVEEGAVHEESGGQGDDAVEQESAVQGAAAAHKATVLQVPRKRFRDDDT